jgi:S-layer family protein
MKRNLLTRVSFTIMVMLFTVSVSGWTGNPIPVLTAPSIGNWTGTTAYGYPVSFTVSTPSTVSLWSNFSLTHFWTMNSCYGTITVTIPGPGSIVSNYFYPSTANVLVGGQFTSATTAQGNLYFQNYPVPGCGLLNDPVSWTAHLVQAPVPTFADVPFSYWAHDWIERLNNAHITGGCATNPLKYCPETTVTRAQMAIFLERGIHGSLYNPPAVGAGTGFTDVSPTYWAAAWVKQLAAEGITGGCGTGVFCPEGIVNRAQIAIFLLRSKHGASYIPPAVGAGTGFTDVPPTYWAGAWIKQLVAEGVTSGCGTGTYCPESPVTRAQMAVFLVKTFNLP